MIPRSLELGVDPRTDALQESSWPSPSIYESLGDGEELQHQPNFGATIAVGVMLIIFGLVVMSASPGAGIGGVVVGVFVIIGALAYTMSDYDELADQLEAEQWADTEAEMDYESALQARQIARQQEIDEIVKAVKQTIRVRCRYCGTLNEESANRCESCGGAL